ncbi:phage baseplate protein [Vibrio diabolicus]|uniref:phage baseplate protein n=1 Tax=Vibrio diabolicus TaxID=50719 RepID=UPI003D7EF38E
MITPTYIMDDNLGRFYADAVTEVSPSYTANATKYPVSDKSVITSNVVKSNPTLSLTCYVGKNPLRNIDGNLLSIDDKEQRPLNAHEILLNWFNKSTPLTIVNEFYNLNNYVIVKYTPLQVGTTDSMQYRLLLEHIRNVSYERGYLLTEADEQKSIDGQRKTNSTNNGFSSKVNKLPDLYKDGYVNLMGLKRQTNEQFIKEFFNREG